MKCPKKSYTVKKKSGIIFQSLNTAKGSLFFWEKTIKTCWQRFHQWNCNLHQLQFKNSSCRNKTRQSQMNGKDWTIFGTADIFIFKNLMKGYKLTSKVSIISFLKPFRITLRENATIAKLFWMLSVGLDIMPRNLVPFVKKSSVFNNKRKSTTF